jgi:hypothetical protein
VKKQTFALVFFGLFWTALVSVFDGFLGYGLVNQLRATHFKQTTGYITHSEMTYHDSDDGTTHGVDIRFHYEADGQPYEGNRFRYGEGSSSDSGWARNAVNRYREGAEVPVYYNPKNPSDSVLSPGVDGSNLMMLLFLTPFNAVMLGFWVTGLAVIRNKIFNTLNGGVPFRQDGPILRVRLPRYPAVFFLLAITGVVGFIEIFPIAFLGGGFHPKTSIVGTALIIAYGAGLASFFWQSWATYSGRSDLAIDASRQIAELPRTFGRKTKIQVPLSKIHNLKVVTKANRGSEGGTTNSYIATLSWRDSDPAEGQLREWYNESKAQAFVDWLRPQLKINSSDTSSSAWKGTMPVEKVSTE